MLGTSQAIYKLLVDDDTLTGMLAENSPFYEHGGAASVRNSIIPSDIANRKLNTPIVVIHEGQELSIGSTLVSETIFIRCYNEVDRSYITINNVLDRVRVLLDDAQLDIDDKVSVRVVWETTIGGVVDDSLGLKFKESRYRILVL